MKRIASILIVVILSALLTLNVFATDYQITVTGFEAKQGETVTVDIKLDTAVVNAINASFSLEFDPEVLQIVKNGDEYDITAGTVFDGFTMLSAGNNTKGYANFGGTAAQGKDISKGVIYSVKFEVLQEKDPDLTLSVNAFALDKEAQQAAYPSIVSDISVTQATVTLPQASSSSSSESSSASSSESSSVESSQQSSSQSSSKESSVQSSAQSSSAASSSESKENSGNSFTGDSIPLYLIGALIVLSIAIAVIAIKKRQHN